MAASAVPPIGGRIRAERLRRGVSVRGLARDVGVSASLISQIETDRKSPSVSTLHAITTALGISVEDLFGAGGGVTGGGVTGRGTARGGVTGGDGANGGDGASGDVAGGDGAGPLDATIGGDGASSATDASPTAVAGRIDVIGDVARVGPPGALVLPGPRGRVVGPGERQVLKLDSGVTWELLGQVPRARLEFLLITYPPGGSSASSGLLMRHSGTECGYLLSGELGLTLGFDEYRLRAGDSISFDCTTPHAYRNDGAEPAVGVWFVLERGT